SMCVTRPTRPRLPRSWMRACRRRCRACCCTPRSAGANCWWRSTACTGPRPRRGSASRASQAHTTSTRHARRPCAWQAWIHTDWGMPMIRMRLAVLPWLLLLSGSALPALANSGPGMRLASGAAGVARIAPPRIDQALSTLVDSGELVGVSALVWQDGREAYFGSFGLADREAGRPMARDTIVQIYSMTKPLTGVALMQLYEQGRLDLDAPLAQYLPEYAAVRVYAGTDVKGKPLLVAPDRPILVRDILRHTAGFASGGNEPGPVGAMYRKADPENFGHTLEQMSRRLAGVPLLYQPGTRWLYSSAVDVQARLVEVL